MRTFASVPLTRPNPLQIGFAALLLSTIPLASATSAEPEWNRFRGPNGSGLAIAPNLPIPFTENDLRWKITLPGRGHSSPVIANGKVFVTATPSDTNKRTLLAVNEADGAILWQKEWEAATFRQHADNSYTSASPAVDGERVYIWWTSPEQSWIAAFDQKDGREIWKRELGGFVSQHGAGSSPVVFENSVILDFSQEGTDGKGSFTICLDARTGNPQWKVDRQSSTSSASTPCIYQSKNGAPQLILINRTSGMTSLDPRTGKTNWELPSLIPKRCVASPVVTDDGLVIAQCGEGQAESFVYAVRPGINGSAPSKVYEVVRTGGYVPTPLAVGKNVFLWKENGLVTCLRADNNEQVWSERVEGPFYGSPICVNGYLLNTTRRGDLVVVKAGEKFEQVARIPLGEGSFATPAVANGRMYLRTFTHLLAVGK
ncbi:outer membrane protein assembly factor BamB family protein [Verrucomicrobiota bacterium sgz303538]